MRLAPAGDVLPKVDTTRFDTEGPGDPHGSIFGLPYGEDESAVVLIPVPWEPTTSYGRGAAAGPEAIRSASPQLDLFDADLAERGCAQPWEYGIHMRSPDERIVAHNAEASRRAASVIAAGGRVDASTRQALHRVDALSDALNAWLTEQTEALLDQDKIVGVVGGDHSVSFGALAAATGRMPGLGILHVDAHADLRDRYLGFAHSHASIMRNVVDRLDGLGALVQVGIRDLSQAEYALSQSHPKVHTWLESKMRQRLAEGTSWNCVCKDMLAPLPERVWVSFDIDGLDPALCPSTGTPVPGGLSFFEAMSLLLAVLDSGRQVVGFDLVEVAPSGRDGDEWDGNVGARILYRLCGLAIASRLAAEPASL